MEKLKISDRVYVATELVASFKDAMFDIVDIGKTTWLCWKHYQRKHIYLVWIVKKAGLKLWPAKIAHQLTDPSCGVINFILHP